MRSIDIHAHLLAECFRAALRSGKDWHGMRFDGQVHREMGLRVQTMPGWGTTPEQRIALMDVLGVDVHVVSTNVGQYYYDQNVESVAAIHRECNDEVHQMTVDYPERFAGLAMLPMQDMKAAINELDRAVNVLGLKGAMINDHVNGRMYDDPHFLPLWKAAEQMGALLFIHQGRGTIVGKSIPRYHLPNTAGNLVEREMTFAAFVFGGVMDKCPDLKVCLAHGGGYTCFGIGRMDRGWQVRPEARVHLNKPPSAYLSKFYYDTVTHSEATLRYLIDTVGIDRVVFGTDWPADMAPDWPVPWILKMESLTQEEKELILWKNLERLLGI